MKKITSFFDVCRSACKNQNVDEVLEERLSRLSSAKEITRQVLKDIFHDICGASSYPLSTAQEDEILKALEQNSLKGKPSLDVWKSLLKYWIRKDASDKVALIIIDVQNDFISGSLALKNCPAKQEGEEVVDVINKLKNDFQFDLVVYTNDWHPKDHCSFITNVSKYPIHASSKVSAKEAKTYDVVVYDGVQPQNQVLWPVHCEQGSEGAKLHPRLQVSPKDQQVYKGTCSSIDSYSAFWDNGKLSQTNLLPMLLDNSITKCLLCGIATDFCVLYSCVDCAEHGFEAYMLDDACRGVAPDSIEEAKKKMVASGVKIINLNQVSSLF